MPYKQRHKQNTYQNLWQQSRRLEWVLSNGPCEQCGSEQSLRVVHMDPKLKNKKVASLWGMTEDKRIEELRKCFIICAECHGKKMRKERLVHPHGSTRYREGCRCLRCRFEHSLRTKRYKGALGKLYKQVNKTLEVAECEELELFKQQLRPVIKKFPGV